MKKAFIESSCLKLARSREKDFIQVLQVYFEWSRQLYDPKFVRFHRPISHHKYSFSLNTHKITQTRKKPFKCGICEETFNQFLYLIRHKRPHTGEIVFKCNIWEKAFIKSCRLIRHKWSHTRYSNFLLHIDDDDHHWLSYFKRPLKNNSITLWWYPFQVIVSSMTYDDKVFWSLTPPNFKINYME